MVYGCVMGLLYSFCFLVRLGVIPEEGLLRETPTFPSESQLREDGSVEASVAGKMASLMSLLVAQESGSLAKSSQVWLGEGLGTISKKLYDRMLKWEFIDLNELKLKSGGDTQSGVDEPEKVVILPGFEVSKSRKKPILSIFTWIQCFGRYLAAMSKAFPESSPGLVSHMLVVVKAYLEVEDPGWRLYDEAFREKMAAKGTRVWKGVDVQIYQETCGGLFRKRLKVGEDKLGVRGVKRQWKEEGQGVCWLFNEGVCKFGVSCKFLHKCVKCGGPHRGMSCTRGREEKRLKKV